MVVSKTILPFRQVESFWLDPRSADPESESWDWSLEAGQRAMLLKARDRGVTHFELFSVSPPWWMLANHNPSGSADPHAENLLPEYHGEFAAYLATIARHARDKWGITFATIEPFNEPASGYWTETRNKRAHTFPPKPRPPCSRSCALLWKPAAFRICASPPPTKPATPTR